MKAHEVMNTSVVKVSPTTSIRLIARLMARESVGIVCVCDEQDHPLGVLTDRDIVVRVCANTRASMDTVQAQEVMTPHPRTCRTNDDLLQVEADMKRQRSGRTLVLGDHDEVIGIITLAEIWHYQSPMEAAVVSQTVMDREYRVPTTGGHYASGPPTSQRRATHYKQSG
jgi:signal-transduction protein with cAMP-binding, CBS, and nucleotidyltransferase domain